MKKIVLCAFYLFCFVQINAQSQLSNIQEEKAIINLNKVIDDKVMVTIIPPMITTNETTYYIPKTVPGTYSIDNYGKLVDDFKAVDKNGKLLAVTKLDENSWKISNATTLDKVTYWVNDTYENEKIGGLGNEDIFSPAGINILEGKNFVLNNHAFVGYFDDKKEIQFSIKVLHPKDLVGTTSLIDYDKSNEVDEFVTSRYFEVIDNPIMYSKSDFEIFNVGDMEILFSVYSPYGVHSAKELRTYIEKTMRAQKAFMGTINANKRYSILLYLSSGKNDAKGNGALEHHTSTTVVFPERMDAESLGEQLKDVVSHEFFHTITPLSIHSKEIQYFDYNNPKMSKHLWLYEGVTEYFANLFQVNQGLISDDEFYKRMLDKIDNAAYMNDTMSFTEMSANVLVKPYKNQYLNVYEKGALIGMCIDIIIREKSNGQRGILDLMKKLSAEYGVNKPFDDDEFFEKIVSLTYPEVGDFLKTYVEGTTTIPYKDYFAKMGVGKAKIKVQMNPFLKDKISPIVTVNHKTKSIIFVALSYERNEFMKNLGLQSGDVIVSINEKPYDLDSIYEMIMEAEKWKEGDAIVIKIQRDGKDFVISGKVKLSYADDERFMFNENSKKALNSSWLKG